MPYYPIIITENQQKKLFLLFYYYFVDINYAKHYYLVKRYGYHNKNKERGDKMRIKEILKGQKFERHFMSDVETVDAEVVGFEGEYFVIVNIGNEKHKVDFSLGGVMRSREKLD